MMNDDPDPALLTTNSKLKIWMPDLSSPPPPVPDAMGTTMYPTNKLHLEPSRSIPYQLKMGAVNRQRYELKIFMSSKAHNYDAFRQRFEHDFMYCSICSEYNRGGRHPMVPVFHKHFSSIQQRIKASFDKNGDYHCTTCKTSVHSLRSGFRYPLLLTSSTLANWQGMRAKNGYPGDKIHIDCIAIPGGRLRNLDIAFRAELGSSHRPVDCLVVGGVNNILGDESTVNIVREARLLKERVLNIPGSTCAFATPPLPPMMTKMKGDNRLLANDYTQEMINLNFIFKDLNAEPGQPLDVTRAPSFQTYGLKSVPISSSVNPRNICETMYRHRPACWREQAPDRQLHLADADRLRCGKAVVKYFMGLYSMIPDRGADWRKNRK